MNEVLIICIFLAVLAEIVLAGIIAGVIALIRRKRAKDRRVIHLYQEHAEVKYK